MLRHWLGRLPTALAILFVLTAYAFFASYGTFEFPRKPWDYKTDKPGEGYYASLAEGFRSGHTHMKDEPDAILKAVHDPYRREVRDQYGAPFLWDASYFEGRYHLYFSPLPVLIFYLPFRWLLGGYPLDSLAGAFFCAWAFIASVLALRGAFASRKLHIPFWVWVLLIGLGNIVPWVLVRVRIYEVAVVAGMAMTASWAYALIRFTETGRTRHAFWMGLWLALAIAARTNLIVLLVITAIVLFQARRRAAFIACFIPLAVVAISLAAYNYARFRNVKETGITYQLTNVPMRNCRRCSVRTIPEGIRVINNLVHYLVWPPHMYSKFPFVDLEGSRLDAVVAFPDVVEYVSGIGPLDPAVLVGGVFALLLVPRRRTLEVQARNGIRLMAGAWLILLVLTTCWYVVDRYTLDFWMLMAVASAILIEHGLTMLQNAGFGIGPLRALLIALAFWSILFCTLLGFMGDQGAFRRGNPALFERLANQLDAS